MTDEKALLQGDLADKLKVRASTIKYYTQLGLLPYETKGANYRRYYKASEVKPILADIDELKRKGYTNLDRASKDLGITRPELNELVAGTKIISDDILDKINDL